ncbi:N-acyl-L-homoserine lactone synthetase-like protein (plasmid) [Rhizorhabdus wittichii RW1]|uniref:N-acyl-L-homoserine lactone synthetase-like protein n=1 Tax=Rhizorhabdus wittichii (strain DSM 6014 / CCUG 31198 / JCM 15750 / NBRC 105917 / EY 4224 / RW1) TaxID=392499 RepID=A0A9J9HGZ7_RHIWR|nr:N-acyl-L-homoserine lactone synthetase-like protein [Rhizorhabdus wittichii RW1]
MRSSHGGLSGRRWHLRAGSRYARRACAGGRDLPVLVERYEIDQFDDAHARYLILADADQSHLASARLLPSQRRHLLADLFADLCDVAPPAGPDIWEITRWRRGTSGTGHQHSLRRSAAARCVTQMSNICVGIEILSRMPRRLAAERSPSANL